MRFTVQLDGAPGYALRTARKGEQFPILLKGFSAAYEGEEFLTRLEGLPSDLLNLSPKELNAHPSMVDHLVATIAPDARATVHINEGLILHARPKRSIGSGEPVTSDDVVEIQRLEPVGVQVKKDEGFLIVFSVGWRKAIYFDFVPIHPRGVPREYDLWKVLGSYYAYVSKQYLFGFAETEWRTLLDQGWFPFIGLRDTTIRKLIAFVRAGCHCDDLVDEIEQEVTQSLDRYLARWATSDCVQPHMELLNRAAERFSARDYPSAVSILFPRIEGVMRDAYTVVAGLKPLRPSALVSTVVDQDSTARPDASFLLPARFTEYLEKVYFAGFKPGQDAPMSRHSLAHGVVDAAKFNARSAILAILTLDQLFFFLPAASR